jgi:O-antigen/teichoic acid export membrane protein
LIGGARRPAALSSLLKRVHGRFMPVAWNAIAYVVPRVAVLVSGLYVAHRWGQEAFARYALAAVTLMVVGNLVGASLGTVASKYVPEFARGDVTLLGRGFASLLLLAVGFSVTLGVAVLCLAPALARAFAVNPPITNLLEIAGVAIAACILNGAMVGLLFGSAKFKHAAFISVLAGGVFAACLVPLNDLAGPGGTLIALAVFYAVSAAAALFIVRVQLQEDLRRSRRHEVRERSIIMLRYFLPMLLAAGMITPVVWLCNAMLARSANGLNEVARFSAGYNWFAVASSIPAVLAQVEFVRMSRSRARGDSKGLARALRLFVAQNLLFVAPVVIAGAAIAGVLMGLFQVDDAQARLCLRLLLAAALVASLGNPAGMFLAVIDRIWIASLLNVGWACIALACASWLRGAGAVGVGVAFLIGYSVHFLVANAIAWRLVDRAPSP